MTTETTNNEATRLVCLEAAQKLRTYVGIYTGDKQARRLIDELTNIADTTRANIPHPINDATGQDSAPFDEDKLLQLFCNWECLQRGEKGKAAWEAIIAHVKEYAARPAPIGAVAPDRRRCKPCGATRGGDNCWKCGTATFEPHPSCGDDPALPPIDRIRALAKEVGYAIGVHGSQQRDFDVIAAPWADNAIGNHALLEHIAKGLTTDNGPAHIISTERKPLGRYAATIQMDGWYKQLDISVCPNEQYAVVAAAPAAPIAEVTADLGHWTPEKIAELDAVLDRYPPERKAMTESPSLLDTIEREPCTLCDGTGQLDASGAICPHCDRSGTEPVGGMGSIWNAGYKAGQQSIAVDGAPSTNSAAERDAARWRFMMAVSDDAEGPEAKALDRFARDEENEDQRPESVQMVEVTDKAIACMQAITGGK